MRGTMSYQIGNMLVHFFGSLNGSRQSFHGDRTPAKNILGAPVVSSYHFRCSLQQLWLLPVFPKTKGFYCHPLFVWEREQFLEFTHLFEANFIYKASDSNIMYIYIWDPFCEHIIATMTWRLWCVFSSFLTPPKINIEPENNGLVWFRRFSSSRGVFSGSMLIFRGCNRIRMNYKKSMLINIGDSLLNIQMVQHFFRIWKLGEIIMFDWVGNAPKVRKWNLLDWWTSSVCFCRH